MKQKKTGLIILVLLVTLSVQSQETSNFTVGVECSSSSVFGSLNKKWSIRQDVGSYSNSYEGYSSGSINTTMDISYIGVKPEFLFLNNKLGIASGLRFTNINSYVENGYGTGNYFYLRYKSDAMGTEYTRVNNITEDNNYLGIPLELRFIPFQYTSWGFYAKVGVDLNLKVSSKTSIDFTSESMKAYEQEVMSSVDTKTSTVYSSFYSSIGVKYGKKNHVTCNLDIFLPSYILTSNNSSLVVPEMYNGFQFTVQFPINRKNSK